MPIELSTLPPVVVEQILKAIEADEPIHFTNNGEIIMTLVKQKIDKLYKS